MDLQHEPPSPTSGKVDSSSLSSEAAGEAIRVEPERALSRAQARDRRWRALRSRRLQRCIDVFARIEWLGYAITEPLILWTFPLLLFAFCGGYYYSGYRFFDAVVSGLCLTIVVVSGISLLGWAIRGLGHGLRKLSLHWGDEQVIEVQDPGEPGE